METNVISSRLAHNDTGFQLLGFLPKHVGRLNNLDGHALGGSIAASHHLDTLVISLVPCVKRQAVLLTSLKVESRRNQPVVGIQGAIVSVSCKPVLVAGIGEIPSKIVTIGVNDSECLLLILSLEGVQVRIIRDDHAIIAKRCPGTLWSVLRSQVGSSGRLMGRLLDGGFHFVLQGILSLGFLYDIPLFVGSRLHSRHIFL